MKPRRADLLGQKFGKLEVIAFHEIRHQQAWWLCRCECGRPSVAQASKLKRGLRLSCGRHERVAVTLLKIKHGQSRDGGTSEYRIWTGMVQRCHGAGDFPAAKYYRDRGITVCDRWRHSFENFWADMGPRPAGLSIDRIDVNGNYEPGNCRWATHAEQAANKRPRQVSGSPQHPIRREG